MPLLHSGAERCTLQPGTYLLGGRGPTALPLASLEWSSEVATIVVPAEGPPTIQRIAASVVVKLDQVPLGIAPKTLTDGVEIEFTGCRLTFRMDDDGDAIVTTSGPHERADVSPPAPGTPPAAPTKKTRLVSVRTGDGIDLGGYRVVIGRDEACDFVLSGMGVSRRHFSVTPVQGGYLLRDESANGTLVNGARVTGTYLLGHGDVVRVDEEELRFEIEGSSAPEPTNSAAPTAILDVWKLRSEFAAEGKREQPARLTASLEIVRGPFAGASFSIDRPVCSIGRGKQNDVQVRDESVSGAHATLLRKGTTWFVVDLRSANGTFVDGLRIAGERELTPGAHLKLGRVEMVFRALDTTSDGSVAAKPKRSWLREFLTKHQRREETGAE